MILGWLALFKKSILHDILCYSGPRKLFIFLNKQWMIFAAHHEEMTMEPKKCSYHWALWDRLGLGKVFPHVGFISISSCHNTQIQLWKLPWASQHLPWMITDHRHTFIVFEFLSISSAWKGGWCALQWRQKTVFRESAGSKVLLFFVYTGHEWQGQAQHGVTWIFLWVISIYSI